MSPKSFLRIFWRPRPCGEPSLSRLQEQGRAAWMLVRAVYAFQAYVILGQLEFWQALAKRPLADPLWPVVWMQWVPWPLGLWVVLVAALVFALGAAIYPWPRWVRAGAAGFFLLQLAAQHSFGKISHTSHGILLMVLALAFIPSLPAQKLGLRAAAAAVTGLQFAQVLFLATYTMSGVGKVWYGVVQAWDGKPGSFHPDSFALHIAQQMIDTGVQPLLAEFFLRTGGWLWPLMLGAVYFQLVSVWVAGRPSLHRGWALLLVVFHVLSQFTLNVGFDQNCFLLLLLFGMSPFAPSCSSARRMVHDLPLVGGLLVRGGLPKAGCS